MHVDWRIALHVEGSSAARAAEHKVPIAPPGWDLNLPLSCSVQAPFP